MTTLRRLLFLAVLLVAQPAWAVVVVTPPGVTCANDPRLQNPVVGQDVCFDSTLNQWNVWSGASWGPESTALQACGSNGRVLFNASGVCGTNASFIWDQTNTRLQLGVLPSGPLAPGPLVVGVNNPSNVTGSQAILAQSITGTVSPGPVTLGSDKVAVSGWSFRGTGGVNSGIYGANFGVVYFSPGFNQGVEIDVQNNAGDTGIFDFGNSRAIWLNRSGPYNSSSAIGISSQDPQGWWYGIHFDCGNAGTCTDSLIKGHGIYFDKAMQGNFMTIVPLNDVDDHAILLYAADGNTQKADIKKRGSFLGRADSTGKTLPTFSFIDDAATGMYGPAAGQIGFSSSGVEIFKVIPTGTILQPYGAASGQTGEMRFGELAANGVQYVAFKAPNAITTSRAIVLPAAPGTNGQCLATDGGSPVETWSYLNCSGGGAGTITSIGGQSGPVITLGSDTNVTLSGAANTISAGWTGTLAVGRGGIGISSGTLNSIPYFSGTTTVSTSSSLTFNGSTFAVSGSGGQALTGVSAANQSLLDLTGTSLPLPGKSAMNGLRWDLALGTSGSPQTVPGPVFKISKTLNVTSHPAAGCVNAIDNECGSAFEVVSSAQATDALMNVGINVLAIGTQTATFDSGSSDNIGVYTMGWKPSGVGSGTGLYAEGRRDVGTSLATGIEIQASNFTNTSCVDPAGAGNDFSDCTGLVVLSKGNDTGGVTGGIGVRVGGINLSGNNWFRVGFGCQISGASASCYEDSSNAVSSMRLRGSHTYGIDLNDSTYSTAAIRMNSGPNSKISWPGGMFIEGNTPSISPGTDGIGQIGDATHRWNNVNAVQFSTGASNGGTQVVTVKNSAGSNCTITYASGLFISTTC